MAARPQKGVKAALIPLSLCPQCCVAPQQLRVPERPPPVVAQQGVGAPLHRQSGARSMCIMSSEKGGAGGAWQKKY